MYSSRLSFVCRVASSAKTSLRARTPTPLTRTPTPLPPSCKVSHQQMNKAWSRLYSTAASDEPPFARPEAPNDAAPVPASHASQDAEVEAVLQESIPESLIEPLRPEGFQDVSVNVCATTVSGLEQSAAAESPEESIAAPILEPTASEEQIVFQTSASSDLGSDEPSTATVSGETAPILETTASGLEQSSAAQSLEESVTPPNLKPAVSEELVIEELVIEEILPTNPLLQTTSSDLVSDDPPSVTVSEQPPPPPIRAPPAGLHAHALTDRALIRLEGPETQTLLQGLVTQDMALLDQNPAIYAMMLNLQGRVLYDVIFYNVSSKGSDNQKYLLECDGVVANEIVSHLKKYKLRKNCDIVDVSDLYDVWAVTPMTERMASISSLPKKSEFAETFDPVLATCRDPRLKDIGWRLISGKGMDVSDTLGGGAVTRPLPEYRQHRYKLGVTEGIADLQPGKSFPLESNLVFLNGVSFSKGCYLGQELTARTHHTGVIRKRIMPLTLSTPISPEKGPFPDSLILNNAGKDAGKFRNAVETQGIGLVRVTMSGGRLIVVGKGSETECYARVPHWWPLDDPEAVIGGEEEDPAEVTEATEVKDKAEQQNS